MAGVSDKLGFTDPTEGGPNPPGSKMSMPSAAPRAQAKLVPDQAMFIQNSQQQQQGGGRNQSFLHGLSEARPGGGLPEGLPGMGDAAAGAGEAAGGADAIGELAPLALAAL
jgi:hypothetical protein